MSWKQLLASKGAQKHFTSKKELDAIRELIARDLADANLTAVSADRRFATAYNAALQAAKMAVACAGYRITARAGHHQITFEAASLALGPSSKQLLDYFETCRRSATRLTTCSRRLLQTLKRLRSLQEPPNFTN